MDTQRTRTVLARALAGAYLDAPAWRREALLVAGARVLAVRPAWLDELCVDVLLRFPDPPREDPAALAATIEQALPPGLSAPPRPTRRARGVPEGSDFFGTRFGTPPLGSAAELGSWLGLGDGQLRWLADTRGWEASAREERLRNYRYGAVPRRSGGAVRLLEEPKAQLKAVQRAVLHGLLERIPVHPAAHGFVRGRSALTHASLHVGRRVVVGFDLEDHFATVHVGRVRAVFAAVGYPPEVAALLAGLSTNVVPPAVWASLPRDQTGSGTFWSRRHRLGRRLAAPHLPQGAPSSPALANLVADRLDRRLAGLAARWEATYSRYADDLTFSGGRRLLSGAPAFRRAVAHVVADEGFVVNEAKSHLTTAAGRQRVTGIVVNRRPNVTRPDYDALKALLHNCARDGPAAHDRTHAADFRAHLEGRVAWVAALNPGRGARLRDQLSRIDWTTTP